jgi:hypothetical protein
MRTRTIPAADELLLPVEFQLEPGAPLARVVPGIASLCNDLLETELPDSVGYVRSGTGKLLRQQHAGLRQHLRQL